METNIVHWNWGYSISRQTHISQTSAVWYAAQLQQGKLALADTPDK